MSSGSGGPRNNSGPKSLVGAGGSNSILGDKNMNDLNSSERRN